MCRLGASWAASCTSTSARMVWPSRSAPVSSPVSLCLPLSPSVSPCLPLSPPGLAPGAEMMSQLHWVAASCTSTSAMIVRCSRLRPCLLPCLLREVACATYPIYEALSQPGPDEPGPESSWSHCSAPLLYIGQMFLGTQLIPGGSSCR